jgi:transcriptional regulator with XRE-family HTH domain
LTKSQILLYKVGMIEDTLKEIIKLSGKSRYRLGKDLKIDQGQLSRFFAGKSSFSLKNVENIIRHLGYSFQFIRNEARLKEEDKIKPGQVEKILEGRIERIIDTFQKQHNFHVLDIRLIDGRVKIIKERGTTER